MNKLLSLRDQIIYEHSISGLERLADEIMSCITSMPSAPKATQMDLDTIGVLSAQLVDVILALKKAKAVVE